MKLGLVLAGPLEPPLPSTRVALLNVLPLLQSSGVSWELLHAPPQGNETPALTLDAGEVRARGIDLVVFQKVYGPSAESLALALRAAGVATIFLVCDRVVPSMCAATDVTVCVTDHLASLYPPDLQQRIQVVHDGVERADVIKTRWRDDRGSALRPLRAVLVTSSRLNCVPVFGRPPAWLHVDIVGDYPPDNQPVERLRAHWRAWHKAPDRRVEQLRALTHPRIAHHAWDAQGVYDRLLRADIGIIPIDRQSSIERNAPPAWSVKSENRLTLKMSVGLPVVATPIPSYECVVDSGRNAFFADNAHEWLRTLERLRDPDLRMSVGRAARSSALPRFGQTHQATRLLKALRQAIKGQRTHRSA